MGVLLYFLGLCIVFLNKCISISVMYLYSVAGACNSIDNIISACCLILTLVQVLLPSGPASGLCCSTILL